MSKQLELLFENEDGRQVTISLESPIEPVDPIAVKNVMDNMLSTNAFTTAGGDFVSIRGARIVERNVEEIELP
ncbi:DUF2922 domain-containing protein [Halalkalibacterium ligniniphilum]|uniref:DUF2922 domain-containing protein n=1 Tax=Halalkalibacterium ligniniphilum TaxID=1134413 RepID=UPI000346CBB2|nr:DUF2922 domain-containing protein [Halalkalibacterium ligniniphilum]